MTRKTDIYYKMLDDEHWQIHFVNTEPGRSYDAWGNGNAIHCFLNVKAYSEQTLKNELKDLIHILINTQKEIEIIKE